MTREFKGLWREHNWTNMHIMEHPEGEDRGKKTEILFSEILTENLSNLRKETDIQIQEAQRLQRWETKRDLNQDTL